MPVILENALARRTSCRYCRQNRVSMFGHYGGVRHAPAHSRLQSEGTARFCRTPAPSRSISWRFVVCCRVATRALPIDFVIGKLRDSQPSVRAAIQALTCDTRLQETDRTLESRRSELSIPGVTRRLTIVQARRIVGTAPAMSTSRRRIASTTLIRAEVPSITKH
jgi:hypothetical protein